LDAEQFKISAKAEPARSSLILYMAPIYDSTLKINQTARNINTISDDVHDFRPRKKLQP
jgi:hypothetical protein